MYIIICIFKMQTCSLVTDVDCSELHVAMETMQAYLKVAKFTNKGQFERYTVWNLAKFASVPELKQFLLENYSVELNPATNHSFTVGYMSDGPTKCKYQNRQTMQVNSFQNANQQIVQMFPSIPLDRIIYGLWSSPDNVFSIRYIMKSSFVIPPPLTLKQK